MLKKKDRFNLEFHKDQSLKPTDPKDKGDYKWLLKKLGTQMVIVNG